MADDPADRPWRDLSAEEVWAAGAPTEAEIVSLPAWVDFAHAARALGISRGDAYSLTRAPHRWPADVPLRSSGPRSRRVLRTDLLAHLGIADGGAAGAHRSVDPEVVDALSESADALERAAASIRIALRRLGR